MGYVQTRSRRRLIDLTRFNAHKPVLHHVDPAYPVGSGNRPEAVDELDKRHPDAVHLGRYTLGEPNLDVRRRVRALSRRAGQGVNLFRWLRPGILEHTALDRAAPEIRIGTVGAVDRRGHQNTPLLGVGDLIGPTHSPHAGGRDHADRGI